jgi:hypothetical protein
MALGKNMRIDKLIPSTESTSQPIKQMEDVSEKQHAIPMDAVPVEKENRTIKTQHENIESAGLKVVFTPSLRKTTKRITVSISGEWHVGNIGLVQEPMSEIFNLYDYVDLVLRDITRIDLSPIQYIQSLRSVYTNQNKSISIDAEFSAEIKTLIMNAGLMTVFSKPRLN